MANKINVYKKNTKKIQGTISKVQTPTVDPVAAEEAKAAAAAAANAAKEASSCRC